MPNQLTSIAWLSLGTLNTQKRQGEETKKCPLNHNEKSPLFTEMMLVQSKTNQLAQTPSTEADSIGSDTVMP